MSLLSSTVNLTSGWTYRTEHLYIKKYSDNQVIIYQSVITDVVLLYCDVLNALCWCCLCNTQMAVRCWVAVTLCLLLFDGNSLAAVDQNQLAPIVDEILNRWVDFYTKIQPIPKSNTTRKHDKLWSGYLCNSLSKSHKSVWSSRKSHSISVKCANKTELGSTSLSYWYISNIMWWAVVCLLFPFHIKLISDNCMTSAPFQLSHQVLIRR